MKWTDMYTQAVCECVEKFIHDHQKLETTQGPLSSEWV